MKFTCEDVGFFLMFFPEDFINYINHQTVIKDFSDQG